MKKLILSVIVVATVATAFLMYGCSGSSGIGPEGISLEEFNRLSLGMKKDKAEEIIGGSGEKISESKEDTEDYIIHTYLYRYEGEKSGYAEIEYTLKSAKELFAKIPDFEITSITQHDLS